MKPSEHLIFIYFVFQIKLLYIEMFSELCWLRLALKKLTDNGTHVQVFLTILTAVQSLILFTKH
jgi:hypothetical protein